MLKALFKVGLFSVFTQNSANKKRSAGKKVGLIIAITLLAAYCIGIFSMTSYNLSYQMFLGFSSEGKQTVACALWFAICVFIGVIGCVFMTNNVLYKAKDNDLLLSMPIPPKFILISRLMILLLSTYVIMYVFMIPAFVAYLNVFTFDAGAFICFLLALLVVPLFAVAFTCLLAWVFAIIFSKMKFKKLISIIFGVLGFGLYLALCFAMGSVLNYGNIVAAIMSKADALGEALSIACFPLYQLAKGICTSDALAVLLGILTSLIFVGIVYLIMNKTYISIATSNRGAKKRKYVSKTVKVSSTRAALVKKELKHVLGSFVYLINSSMGSFFSIIFAVAMLVGKSQISGLLSQYSVYSEIICCSMIFSVVLLSSTNTSTSCSISLESKNLWLLKSLPVKPIDVLMSKIYASMILTVPFVLLDSIVLAIILPYDALLMILLFIIPIVSAFASAAFGLILNLWLPKLNWINETQAIKNSLSAFLAAFIPIFAVAIFALIWVGLMLLVDCAFAMLIVLVILIGLSALFVWYLCSRAPARFENIG